MEINKKNLLLLLKLTITLICCILSGTILLYLVFLLPVNSIRQNILKTAYVFSIEGAYPVMEGNPTKMLDDFTDALILENTFFQKEGVSVMDRAMNVYHPEFESTDHSICIQQYADGDTNFHTVSYPRYWHGYLVLLKPLLMMLDYLQFRTLNRIIQSVLILFVLVFLWKKLSPLYMLPFGASILFLRPDAVALSLQYSPVFYVSMLSILIILFFHDKLMKGDRYIFFFLLNGAVINYLDFLTYPIVALGLPVCLWLCFQEKSSFLENIRGIILYSFAWGMGYAGMWAGKWTISSIILQKNIFQQVMGQILFRSAASDGTDSFSRISVVLKNLYMGFEGHIWVLPLMLTFICILGLWRAKGHSKDFIQHAIPFLLISIMPVAWHIVMANHSYIHTWFTYRGFAVSVGAILAILPKAWNPSLSRSTSK